MAKITNVHSVKSLQKARPAVARSHQRRPRPRIKKPMLYGLIGLVVIGTSIGGYVFIQRMQANNEQVAPKTVPEQIVADTKAKLAKPLPPTASEAEKRQHFTDALWVKAQEADDKQVADYYLKTVLPSGVSLEMEMSQVVARSLIITGNTTEAKALVQKIIALYDANPPLSDPALQQYVAERKQSYIDLEKSL